MNRVRKAIQQENKIARIIELLDSLVLCDRCKHYVTPEYDESGLVCVFCKRGNDGTITTDSTKS